MIILFCLFSPYSPVAPSHCTLYDMDGIKATFARCKEEQRAALVTYVTAGYPTSEETVDILLAMEAGGAGQIIFDCPIGILLTSFDQISLSSVSHSQIQLRTDPQYRKQTLRH